MPYVLTNTVKMIMAPLSAQHCICRRQAHEASTDSMHTVLCYLSNHVYSSECGISWQPFSNDGLRIEAEAVGDLGCV